MHPTCLGSNLGVNQVRDTPQPACMSTLLGCFVFQLQRHTLQHVLLLQAEPEVLAAEQKPAWHLNQQ